MKLPSCQTPSCRTPFDRKIILPEKVIWPKVFYHIISSKNGKSLFDPKRNLKIKSFYRKEIRPKAFFNKWSFDRKSSFGRNVIWPKLFFDKMSIDWQYNIMQSWIHVWTNRANRHILFFTPSLNQMKVRLYRYFNRREAPSWTDILDELCVK
jgi:hypothetical protein